MIKTLTKIFALTAVTKSLLETKKSQSEGTTQLHPSKIPGRTLFIREKEFFVSLCNNYQHSSIADCCAHDMYKKKLIPSYSS